MAEFFASIRRPTTSNLPLLLIQTSRMAGQLWKSGETGNAVANQKGFAPMPLLTIKQAAEALAISVRHLINLSEDGEIPYVNVGRGTRKIRRYDPADIEAFKSQRKTVGVAEQQPASSRRVPRSSPLTIVDFRALLEERRSRKRK
ncbi:helix-turn-helix domain-containing protein [Ochrobactrum sp. C6C9]|uniref:helix-turn-helix domain-containing protein n=1 Tax=Ochrobactrum sp. C6C9 TaxID=2736662 RepID=UPI0035302451|nr:helix-turn-helix domain-containing protein [Ochrobactrum sp. C6C9]